jgi:hypothetical protein
LLNPLIVNGQLHGGIAQGIGQALLEQVAYDPASGQLLSGSFMDFALPRADDLPLFTTAFNPIAGEDNPLGVKGIGEGPTTGSPPYDNIANCLPPGMPAMMGMAYGMEVMQNEERITFFSEWQDALRRVYLDGRTPSSKVLNDPTYAGYSTGHWEGDTLVVETVALSTNSFIDGSSPHSERMTVHERIRFIAADILEDRITVFDPEALIEPWQSVRTYKKAPHPNDELREFACAEGLRDVPR